MWLQHCQTQQNLRVSISSLLRAKKAQAVMTKIHPAQERLVPNKGHENAKERPAQNKLVAGQRHNKNISPRMASALLGLSRLWPLPIAAAITAAITAAIMAAIMVVIMAAIMAEIMVVIKAAKAAEIKLQCQYEDRPTIHGQSCVYVGYPS